MKISWGRLFLAAWTVAASTAVSTAPAETTAGGTPRAGGACRRGADPQRRRRAKIRKNTSSGPSQPFVDTYCATCHNQRLKTAGLLLDTMDVANVAADAPAWEKVVVKLRAGLMPPAGVRRPAQAVIDEFASSVETALDQRGGGPAQSGTHRDLASLESGRIPQCDPRPAGARHRRHRPAAGRRDQLRLRQYRRRPEAVAAADRALSQRRAEGVAARAGDAGAAQWGYLQSPRSAQSGCPARGYADGHAGRQARRLRCPAGRRIRHQGEAGPGRRLRRPALPRRAAA